MRFLRLAVPAALGVLTACTAVVVDDRPLGPDRDRVCTRQYEPVCARRGQSTRTFPNSCEARSEGYRPVYDGRCRGDRDWDRDWDRDRDREPDRYCAMVYAPVCARRIDMVRTFPNRCEAQVAGYEIIREDACR